MQRREFLALSAGLTLLPLTAAASGDPVPDTPGAAEAAMDEGRVVLLDFWASWCSTCAAQERVLAALKAENPAYGRQIMFFVIDWDRYGNGDLARALNVPRRSTLIALKGREELGRIVAGTSKDEIRALLDTAIAAA